MKEWGGFFPYYVVSRQLFVPQTIRMKS